MILTFTVFLYINSYNLEDAFVRKLKYSHLLIFLYLEMVLLCHIRAGFNSPPPPPPPPIPPPKKNKKKINLDSQYTKFSFYMTKMWLLIQYVCECCVWIWLILRWMPSEFFFLFFFFIFFFSDKTISSSSVEN